MNKKAFSDEENKNSVKEKVDCNNHPVFQMRDSLSWGFFLKFWCAYTASDNHIFVSYDGSFIQIVKEYI